MTRLSFRHSQILQFEQTKQNSDKNTSRRQYRDYPPMAPKFTMDQVVLTEELREDMEEVMFLVRHKELIYERWGFSEVESEPKFVLSFYGPSGTGKTMCAHALASALNCPIMALNYADIESKYVGDAPKNVVRAFQIAQESGAVLFFDEADSLLSSRIADVSSSADQSINSLRSQLLIQLENFQGIVIFATNLVQNYDFAFQTRILKSIAFELPDDAQRRAILHKMLPQKLPFQSQPSKKEWLAMIKETREFSGRDIKAAILGELAHVARTRGTQAQFTAQDFIHGFRRRRDEMKAVTRKLRRH